jgi:hypothetical protein
MRRVDMIPLALLAALAGAVGFRIVQQPHVATPAPITITPVPAEVRALADTAETRVVVIDTAPVRSAAPVREAPAFVPGPRSDEINRRLRYGAAGTYILEMLDGRSTIIRWETRPTEAIRVWVDPAPKVPAWDPRFAAAARDGVSRWTAAGIPVRINFVVDSSDAEVKVEWTERLEDLRVGVTQTMRDGDYWIRGANITIATRSQAGGDMTVADVRAVASHEAGHMLGLGHSSFALDIMAPGYSTQIEPSPSDLKTLRLLYTIPPGRFR